MHKLIVSYRGAAGFTKQFGNFAPFKIWDSYSMFLDPTGTLPAAPLELSQKGIRAAHYINEIKEIWKCDCIK